MSDDTSTTIDQAEAEIAGLLPTACDMIATVLGENPPTFETYAGLMEVAEQASPLLLCAVVRMAAGLAYMSELTPDDVRGMPALLGGKIPKGIPT